jgi:hypothetical protein
MQRSFAGRELYSQQKLASSCLRARKSRRWTFLTKLSSDLPLAATPTGSLQHDMSRSRGEAVMCLAAVGEERAAADTLASPAVLHLQSLKEWAPTCAALGNGDQTVSAALPPLELERQQ